MKGIIITEIPEYCGECIAYDDVFEECKASCHEEKIEEYEMPDWCPIKPTSDDPISRKALSEEIKSLRISITGSGNGEIDAYKLLKEYKKTVLRCIEEAPIFIDTSGECK